MKDALGHGSNSGMAQLGPSQALPPLRKTYADAEAARALAQGHPKSEQVGVNPGARGHSMGDALRANLAGRKIEPSLFSFRKVQRRDRAVDYVASRAARPSNFKLR